MAIKIRNVEELTLAKSEYSQPSNVNIGGEASTSTPYKLAVSRINDAPQYHIAINTESAITDNNYGGIVFTQGNNLQTPLGSIKLVHNTNGYADISFNTRSVSDVLYLKADGKIGANKVPTTYTLEVNGDVEADNFRGNIIGGTIEGTSLTISGGTFGIDGKTIEEYITDTVGGMIDPTAPTTNVETGIGVSFDDATNTLDFVLNAAQTTITSLLATDIKIGEDNGTKVDFETANEIHLYADNSLTVNVVKDKVGIGTGSGAIGAKLHIEESSAGALVTPLKLINPNQSVGSAVAIDFKLSADTVTAAVQLKAISPTVGADGELVISTRKSGVGLVERVRVSTDGNVGIGTGTSVLGNKLTVQLDDANTSITNGSCQLELVNVNATNGNYSRIFFNDAVGGNASALIGGKIVNHTNNYGDLEFWTRGATGYGTRLTIDSDGDAIFSKKVGIGTGSVAPAEKLDVRGNISWAGTHSSEVGRLISTDTDSVGIVAVDEMAFYVANANVRAMHIAADGKVGIGTGTTAPSALLEIKSSSQAKLLINRDAANDAELEFKNTEQSWTIGIDRSNSNAFSVSTGTSLGGLGVRVHTDGKVGIGTGTTAPTHKLEIKGLGSNTDVLNLHKGSGVGGLRFTFDGTNYVSYIRTYESGTLADNYMALGVSQGNTTAGADVMRLMGDGKVGIGTGSTAPTKKLEINAGDILLSNIGLNKYGLLFGEGANQTMGLRYDGTGSNGNLEIVDGSNNLLVNFEYDGNVGIGTGSTAPDHLLTIHGDGSDTYIKNLVKSNHQVGLEWNRTRTDLVNGVLQTDYNNNWIMYMPASSTDLRFYSGGDRVTFAADGKVGIGTGSNTLTYDLTVQSSASADILIGSTSGSRALLILDGANNGDGIGGDYAYLAQETDGRLKISNINANNTIEFEGKVGIGTGSVAPAAKLEVYDSTINSLDLLHLRTEADSVNDYVGLKFAGSTDSNGATLALSAIRSYGGPSAGDSYLALLTSTDSDGSNVLIQGLVQDHRGYVGIGTGLTAPVSRLHVVGSGSWNHTPGQNITSDVVITSSEMSDDNAHSILQLVSVRQSLTTGRFSTGYLGFTTMDDSNGQGVRDAGRIAIVNEAGNVRNSATALSFWTNAGGTDTTAPTEKLRIASDGKVGIGTTSFGTSTGKFFVGAQPYDGSGAIAQFGGFIRVKQGIYISDNTTPANYVGWDIIGNSLVTHAGGAGTHKVGIGTGTGTIGSRLHVKDSQTEVAWFENSAATTNDDSVWIRLKNPDGFAQIGSRVNNIELAPNGTPSLIVAPSTLSFSAHIDAQTGDSEDAELAIISTDNDPFISFHDGTATAGEWGMGVDSTLDTELNASHVFKIFGKPAGSPSAATMAAGTTRFSIDTDGNVNIGTGKLQLGVGPATNGNNTLPPEGADNTFHHLLMLEDSTGRIMRTDTVAQVVIEDAVAHNPPASSSCPACTGAAPWKRATASVVIRSDGVIIGVRLIDGGQGYSNSGTPPIVEIKGGGGSGAEAEVTSVIGGVIKWIALKYNSSTGLPKGGFGYHSVGMIKPEKALEVSDILETNLSLWDKTGIARITPIVTLPYGVGYTTAPIITIGEDWATSQTYVVGDQLANREAGSAGRGMLYTLEEVNGTPITATRNAVPSITTVGLFETIPAGATSNYMKWKCVGPAATAIAVEADSAISQISITECGDGYETNETTSTSSIAIPNTFPTSKTFTVGSGLYFKPGMTAIITRVYQGAPAPSYQMTGHVTSYSGTTLVVSVVKNEGQHGSTTYNSWKIVSAPAITVNNTGAGCASPNCLESTDLISEVGANLTCGFNMDPQGVGGFIDPNKEIVLGSGRRIPQLRVSTKGLIIGFAEKDNIGGGAGGGAGAGVDTIAVKSWDNLYLTADKSVQSTTYNSLSDLTSSQETLNIYAQTDIFAKEIRDTARAAVEFTGGGDCNGVGSEPCQKAHGIVHVGTNQKLNPTAGTSFDGVILTGYGANYTNTNVTVKISTPAWRPIEWTNNSSWDNGDYAGEEVLGVKKAYRCIAANGLTGSTTSPSNATADWVYDHDVDFGQSYGARAAATCTVVPMSSGGNNAGQVTSVSLTNEGDGYYPDDRVALLGDEGNVLNKSGVPIATMAAALRSETHIDVHYRADDLFTNSDNYLGTGIAKTASSVHVGNNTITLAASHGVETGDVVFVDNDTGTIPSGLKIASGGLYASPQVYYARVSVNVIYLHLTEADAFSATSTVDITSTGSGAWKFYLGQVDGVGGLAPGLSLSPDSRAGSTAGNNNELRINVADDNSVKDLSSVVPDKVSATNAPADNASRYLTFVAGNNASPTAEPIYTDAGITYNPANNDLSIGNILKVGGNVGVGTSLPQAALDLGSGTANRGMAWGGTSGTAHYATIWTEHSNANLILGSFVKPVGSSAGMKASYTTSSHAMSAIKFDASTGDILFYGEPPQALVKDVTSLNTIRMRVGGDGKVGIGTGSTAPSSLLHIKQSSGADSVMLDIESNNDGGIRFGRSGHGSLIYHRTTTKDFIGFICNGSAQPTAPSSAQLPMMVINEDGNVGIGTGSAAPLSRLEVKDSTNTSSSTTASTLLSLTNYVGSDLSQQKSFIEFNLTDDNSNGLPQVKIGAEVGENADADSETKEGSGAFVIYTGTGTSTTANSLTEKMRVDHAGKVGIGTPSTGPIAKLDVSLSQTNGALTENAFAHFGSQQHTNGSIMGITLGYRENSLNYRKIGLVAAGIGDNAARQDFHILVDSANDGYSVQLSDSKFKIDGLTGDVSISNRLFVDGNADFDGTLNVQGVTTLQSHLAMGDGDEIKLGAGADLQIYHSGAAAYIDNNTSHLYIRNNVDNDDGGNIYIRAKAGENGIIVHDDGAVDLYHDGSIKLSTLSSGVDITGDVSVGGVLKRTAHHKGHLEGSYNNVAANSTKSNPIYTIGSSYNPTDAALSNMYGIGYSHTNATFINSAIGGSDGWGMYVAADGDARIFLNASLGEIRSTGSHYVNGARSLTTADEGAGNGIGADTVDGYHATGTTNHIFQSLGQGTTAGGDANELKIRIGDATKGIDLSSFEAASSSALGGYTAATMFGSFALGATAPTANTISIQVGSTTKSLNIGGISITGNAGSVDGYHATGTTAHLLQGLAKVNNTIKITIGNQNKTLSLGAFSVNYATTAGSVNNISGGTAAVPVVYNWHTDATRTVNVDYASLAANIVGNTAAAPTVYNWHSDATRTVNVDYASLAANIVGGTLTAPTVYNWHTDATRTVKVDEANKLVTGRTIAATGDITWTSPSFNGSGNVTAVAAIGTGVIVNADVHASAAIAYSKLGSIPTWNQNTTGTAAGLSGTPSITVSTIGCQKITQVSSGTGSTNDNQLYRLSIRDTSAEGSNGLNYGIRCNIIRPRLGTLDTSGGMSGGQASASRITDSKVGTSTRQFEYGYFHFFYRRFNYWLSDSRYKENMQPNDLGLDFVRLLEPISFTWKDSRSDNPRRSFGIRVEDVENAIETLGIENSGIVCIPDYEKLSEEEREEAPKHVEETSMIAMLISAIKQLDAKVADLEEKLKAKE